MEATTREADTATSAYLFECKGIQRYIFGSGRLRQVIGASDLIAGIARSDGDDVLKSVFDAVDLGQPAMSRRAGAAFCVHAHREALARFRRLWRIVTGALYPGLEFSDIEPAVTAETDLKAARGAYSRLTAVRENSAAFLPPTGHSVVATNPRTGLPAVARPRQDENAFLDAVGAAAHGRGEALADGTVADRLTADFLPEAEAKAHPPYRFPRHFEPKDATSRNPAFPFPGRDRRIGVIHADLSGLGQVFQSLMDSAKSSRDIFEVATAIEKAIVAAARATCGAVLLPCSIDPSVKPNRFGRLLGRRDGKNAKKHRMRIVPARPVLLGGDDVTIIVRADLAISFTEHFLRGVEEETEKAFNALQKRFPGLPERLSACAGIAIVSAGHPFTVAERLAEGLCDSAKTRAKSGAEAPYPSYLDFAVVTSTIDESLSSWRGREQTIAADVPKGCGLLSTCAGPRRVGPVGPHVASDSLGALFDLAEKMKAARGRGKLIEALGLRHDSKDSAQTAWNRFWTVLKSDNPTAERKLREALKKCEPATEDDGPPDLDRSIALISDALELLDIGAAPRPRDVGTDEEVTP